MGDYSDTLGFTSVAPTNCASKSSDYSTNGDYSVKCVFPSGSTGLVRYTINDVENLVGKTVSFSADVKTKESVKLELFEYYSGGYHVTATIIAASSTGNFQVTKEITSETSSILLDIAYAASETDNTVYTDNWKFIIQ